MRITKLADSAYGADFLQLGFQTNPPVWRKAAEWKANVWAPKGAKSYTILQVYHVDTSGAIVDEPTGAGTIRVAYFTTKKEGEHPIVPKTL